MSSQHRRDIEQSRLNITEHVIEGGEVEVGFLLPRGTTDAVDQETTSLLGSRDKVATRRSFRLGTNEPLLTRLLLVLQVAHGSECGVECGVAGVHELEGA